MDPSPSPSKKPAPTVHQHPEPPSHSSVFEALFEQTDKHANQATIDLTAMSSSSSDTDSFHDASLDVDDRWDDTPGSSQGLDSATPKSDGSSAPRRKKPGQVDDHRLMPPRSRNHAPAERQKAPDWQLFREEFSPEGTPERIFLPMHADARKGPPKVKAEPIEAELHNPQRDAEAARSSAAIQIVEENPRAETPHLLTKVGNDTEVSTQSGKFRRMPVFSVIPTDMRLKIFQPQPDGRCAVPWGVQFYLASLVSFGLLSLHELQYTGINLLRSRSNADAICALFNPDNQSKLWDPSHTETPITARRETHRERQVCVELDREGQILEDSRLNGVIGPPGEEMRSFGGRVLFEGRISCTKIEDKPRRGTRRKHRAFTVHLLPPKLGGSCRFSRRFGSESILRLKMDPAMAKDAKRFAVHPKTREIQQEISDFFAQNLLIMGRYYRPFICKDDTIFYIWMGSEDMCPDKPELDCVWDFLNHHAPFAENSRSQLGKFMQRVHLGLSTSVPVSVLEEMSHVPDIFGDPDPETGKSEEMTDGAGAVSLAVAHDVSRHLGTPSVPAAFQGRIAGAKGVWYLDPAAERWLPGENPKRWVQIRNSQNKINYPKDRSLDMSQTVVDLLGPARLTWPSTLSKQIILVQHSNGVPINTFAKMQEAELRAIVDEVSNWEGPDKDVCPRLATVVDRLCKIETLRARRSTEAAEHRAQGLDTLGGGKSADKDPHSFDNDRDVFFGSDGRHISSGKPVSKYECAYEMLCIGWHPKSCSYLANIMIDIANMAMQKVIAKFAIPVARSAEAMVIPDPTGTLEEGEIQFRFSGDTVCDPDTKLRLQHVPEGDVLVTRHPCLLPTDIRKVRAVVRPELSLYQDVVVFSTKGQRPLASLLSGGDYDGDLIRVFWEPELVKPFKNADVSFADSPFDISDAFHRSEATVADFVAEYGRKDKDERDRALIKELIAGAFEPAVRGLYGAMHLYAAWQFGTDSREAVELAHKFCQCMDSQKTGLTIIPEVRIRDSKKYLGHLPDWAYDETDEADPRDWFARDDHNTVQTAVKNNSRPESVLCSLWNEGKKEVDWLKQRLREQAKPLEGVEDLAISGLWKEAKRLMQVKPEEEEAIRNHVKVMLESFKRTNLRTRQIIESRHREQRQGHNPAVKFGRQSKGVPLRRVRSEATPALLDRSSTSEQLSEGGATKSTVAVDDLNGGDMVERLEESIEVPAILGSASEVAARFCQWPKAFAQDYYAKMDKAAKARLELLRASYAYSVTYRYNPNFAFEMAWCWIMNMKAEALEEPAQMDGAGRSSQYQTQGRGSIQVPFSTLDVMGLRRKIISRNWESSQGRSIEL